MSHSQVPVGMNFGGTLFNPKYTYPGPNITTSRPIQALTLEWLMTHPFTSSGELSSNSLSGLIATVFLSHFQRYKIFFCKIITTTAAATAVIALFSCIWTYLLSVLRPVRFETSAAVLVSED